MSVMDINYAMETTGKYPVFRFPVYIMLQDHSVWSSCVHKTPLQTRACSLFTSQLFCTTIFSCSLISKERIYVDPSLCFIHRDTDYD